MATTWAAKGRKLLLWVATFLGVLLLAAAVASYYFSRKSPVSRDWVVETIESRYQCEVELAGFHVSYFPLLRIEGEGLILRRKEQPGLPPLASIRKFSAHATWLGLVSEPRHFGEVRMEGLALSIPPHSTASQARPATVTETVTKTAAPAAKRQLTSFVLDEVLADDATLSIISANPAKPPHFFAIHKLRMQAAGLGQPMSFQVTLTNPKPVGEIRSKGQFGPWNVAEPSLTPVSGSFSFSNADLGTIRGLGGKLSSRGLYQGVLNQIQVQGETDTPDFDLGVSGNKVHLTTQFNAVVDGVTGDTLLQPVTAQLLGSKIVARGKVVRVPGGSGREILLDVSAQPARLEDLLRLAVKSPSPSMTGAVSLHTNLDLQPGHETIMQRLKLDGVFDVQSARFTNRETEEKMTGFSRRAQGKPGEPEIQNIPFHLEGRFALGESQAKFSSLNFSLPGASIQLDGTFGLVGQTLDFAGTARLQAKVSQTMTGFKSLLLKVVDPLFARDGAGTVLPIEIKGTREKPAFKLDYGKLFKK
jgi:hypothetical protein